MKNTCATKKIINIDEKPNTLNLTQKFSEKLRQINSLSPARLKKNMPQMIDNLFQVISESSKILPKKLLSKYFFFSKNPSIIKLKLKYIIVGFTLIKVESPVKAVRSPKNAN